MYGLPEKQGSTVGVVIVLQCAVYLACHALDGIAFAFLIVEHLLHFGLFHVAHLGIDSAEPAGIRFAQSVQLVDGHLELRVFLDVILESLLIVGIDGELAGFRIPKGLLLGGDHELDEFPFGGLPAGVAVLGHPQGGTAHRNTYIASLPLTKADWPSASFMA